MKVTTIGTLAIKRCETPGEMRSVRNADIPNALLIGAEAALQSDASILARIQCSTLVDDEYTADANAKCATAIVALAGWSWGMAIDCVQPPERCVINRKRSIEAGQAAMAAGFCDEQTEAEVLAI